MAHGGCIFKARAFNGATWSSASNTSKSPNFHREGMGGCSKANATIVAAISGIKVAILGGNSRHTQVHLCFVRQLEKPYSGGGSRSRWCKLGCSYYFLKILNVYDALEAWVSPKAKVYPESNKWFLRPPRDGSSLGLYALGGRVLGDQHVSLRTLRSCRPELGDKFQLSKTSPSDLVVTIFRVRDFRLLDLKASSAARTPFPHSFKRLECISPKIYPEFPRQLCTLEFLQVGSAKVQGESHVEVKTIVAEITLELSGSIYRGDHNHSWSNFCCMQPSPTIISDERQMRKKACKNGYDIHIIVKVVVVGFIPIKKSIIEMAITIMKGFLEDTPGVANHLEKMRIKGGTTII
eukprot:Gb_40843 [translate_table: standard]